MNGRSSFAFGPYAFRADALELSCHGIKIPVMPRSAQVLGYLLANPDRVVTKIELLDALWADEDVNEANLAQHVFLLRKTLSRHSPIETYILTVTGRGYRFVAPVRTWNAASNQHTTAWRHYVRGRYFSDQRTERSLRSGLEAYEESLRIDPNLAPALAGLASCRALRAEYLFAPPSEMDLARDVARRALLADGDNVEAYLVLGDVALFRDWDFRAAGTYYDRAMALDPASSRVQVFRAWYDAIDGRYDRAYEGLSLALTRDPFSLELMTTVAAVAVHEGDYERARRQCDDVLQLDGTYALARYYRRAAMAYGERPLQAVEDYENDGLAEYSQQALAIVGFAAAKGGATTRAHAILDVFAGWPARGYLSPFNVAHVLLGLGRNAEAHKLLADGIERGDLWSVFLPNNKPFSRLPGFARLRELVLQKRSTVPRRWRTVA